MRIPGASRTRDYVYPVSGGSESRSWEGEECVSLGSLHVLRWNPRREKNVARGRRRERDRIKGDPGRRSGVSAGIYLRPGVRCGGVRDVTKVDDSTVCRSGPETSCASAPGRDSPRWCSGTRNGAAVRPVDSVIGSLVSPHDQARACRWLWCLGEAPPSLRRKRGRGVNARPRQGVQGRICPRQRPMQHQAVDGCRCGGAVDDESCVESAVRYCSLFLGCRFCG